VIERTCISSRSNEALRFSRARGIVQEHAAYIIRGTHRGDQRSGTSPVTSQRHEGSFLTEPSGVGAAQLFTHTHVGTLPPTYAMLHLSIPLTTFAHDGVTTVHFLIPISLSHPSPILTATQQHIPLKGQSRRVLGRRWAMADFFHFLSLFPSCCHYIHSPILTEALHRSLHSMLRLSLSLSLQVALTAILQNGWV